MQQKNQQQKFTSIKDLNTFLFDWKIKARVTKKHPLKQWNNNKGHGTLLNVELIDSDGSQIVATFFNDSADKYNDFLKQNKVYIFTNGSIKIANQKYTSIKNQFSLLFDRNSEIEETEDDIEIKELGFCFTPIKEIADI